MLRASNKVKVVLIAALESKHRGRFGPAAPALLCCALLFVLAGCATPSQRTTSVDAWPLLTPAALGSTQQVKQLLRGAFGAQDFNLQCAVTVEPGKLAVIGVTALGLRAFTLDYDGKQLKEERAPQLPDFVSAQQLLNDLQLAFWPLPELQSAYRPAQGEVVEPFKGTRRLLRQGRLLAEVHYADANPWSGRLWLSNFVYGYSLYIETSPLEMGAR